MSFDLSSRALLVSLNVSSWDNRCIDKRATAEVTRNHGAVAGSTSVSKRLLPNCGTWEAVKAGAASIRATFYANTLPWGGADNMHLLPSARYLTTMQWFRTERSQWLDVLVPAFLHEYAAEYNSASGKYAARLGTLHDWKDYPTPAEMAKRFSMDISVSNVPSSDFRCGLGADIQEELRRKEEHRVKAAHDHAMRELWERLYKPVSHAATKLSDPNATFRDSLIANITEICSVLPEFNVSDDPTLETMRRDVLNALTKTSPDALRSDPTVRQQTADAAVDLAKRMSTVLASF
jgi:hypothetical protein